MIHCGQWPYSVFGVLTIRTGAATLALYGVHTPYGGQAAVIINHVHHSVKATRVVNAANLHAGPRLQTLHERTVRMQARDGRGLRVDLWSCGGRGCRGGRRRCGRRGALGVWPMLGNVDPVPGIPHIVHGAGAGHAVLRHSLPLTDDGA